LVKLQRRFAYRYKEKEHYKHLVTIPNEYIQKLGWKADIELELRLEKDKLVMRAKKKNE